MACSGIFAPSRRIMYIMKLMLFPRSTLFADERPPTSFTIAGAIHRMIKSHLCVCLRPN